MTLRFRIYKWIYTASIFLSTWMYGGTMHGAEPHVIDNAHYRLGIDSAGRGVQSIVHKGLKKPLLSDEDGRPCLAVMVGRRGVVPMEYAQDDLTLVESTQKGRRIAQRYRVPDEKIFIDVDWIGDDSPWLTLRCRVRNASDLVVMSVTLPDLDGLAFGEPGDDVLCMPDHAGRFIENPGAYGQYLRAYCGSASMCWMDLYDPAGGGLYIGGVNRPVLMTDLQTASSVHGGGRLTLRRHLSLAPGKEATFEYTLGLHKGDWHTGADRYREAFRAAWAEHDYGTVPKWMQVSDGYSGDRDPDELKWVGIRHSQNWGHAGAGACPTYYLPHDRGLRGPNLEWSVQDYLDYQDTFAAINGRLREGNCSVGYYIHGESISPYYCFADQLYGLPKKDFPDELLPPDGQWYKRNRLYWHPDDDPEKTPDWQSLWDPPKKRGKSFPVMSCTSPEWHDYLVKWSTKYVADYNCNVMYYDTIGARPPFIDYNPHLGYYHNGEWTEGIMAMFKKIRDSAEATGKVDNMGILIEGCGDVYGLVAGHMTSNFDEGQGVYRYTLPEQVLYSGLSNGGWTNPKNRLRRAFIHGSRFDLLKTGYFFKRLVALRRATRRFTYHPWAAYRDTIGLDVLVGGTVETALEGTGGGGPGIEEGEGVKEDPAAKDKPGRTVSARWFRVIDEGTKAVMIAFDNPDGVDNAMARLQYDAAEFDFKRAFAFTLDGEVLPWELHARKGSLAVKVPTTLLSAVVIVDEVAGDRAVNVWFGEDYTKPEPAVEALLTNLSGKQQEVTLSLGAEGNAAADLPGKTVTLEPGEIRRVPFDRLPAQPPLTATLRAAYGGESFDHWIGVMPLVKQGGFENRAPVADAFEGKASAVVRGPGKGKKGRKWTTAGLFLKPGFTYKVSAMVKREGAFRHSTFTLLDYAPKHNTFNALGGFAGASKAHDWTRFEKEFAVPADANNPVFYFYVHDGDIRMLIDDLRAEPVNGE